MKTAKRVATAIALTLGLLVFWPAALAQLPPAIQAEQQVRERDYAAALRIWACRRTVQERNANRTPALSHLSANFH